MDPRKAVSRPLQACGRPQLYRPPAAAMSRHLEISRAPSSLKMLTANSEVVLSIGAERGPGLLGDPHQLPDQCAPLTGLAGKQHFVTAGSRSDHHQQRRLAASRMLGAVEPRKRRRRPRRAFAQEAPQRERAGIADFGGTICGTPGRAGTCRNLRRKFVTAANGKGPRHSRPFI